MLRVLGRRLLLAGTAPRAAVALNPNRLNLNRLNLNLPNLDLHVHAGRQIELHQRIHRLVGRIDDVHQPEMGPDLELLARGLVGMRRAQQVEARLARRQRYRTAHDRAGALGRVDDLQRRLVDQTVVERFQANADSLAFHVPYSMTLATTTPPTVLPPSRMAKRSPCSIAIAVISVTTILMLSPGMAISVPLGSSTAPVTSVVRK